MNINIFRTYYPDATTGLFTVDEGKSLFSIEQPWNDNKEGASCVREGEYKLIPYNSPEHGWTWCLHNPDLGVWATPDLIPTGIIGRSVCEIHPANWAFQLKGCVAVGLSAGPLSEYPELHAVDSSVEAYKRLVSWLTIEGNVQAATGWTLTISSPTGYPSAA